MDGYFMVPFVLCKRLWTASDYGLQALISYLHAILCIPLLTPMTRNTILYIHIFQVNLMSGRINAIR